MFFTVIFSKILTFLSNITGFLEQNIHILEQIVNVVFGKVNIFWKNVNFEQFYDSKMLKTDILMPANVIRTQKVRKCYFIDL